MNKGVKLAPYRGRYYREFFQYNWDSVSETPLHISFSDLRYLAASFLFHGKVTSIFLESEKEYLHLSRSYFTKNDLTGNPHNLIELSAEYALNLLCAIARDASEAHENQSIRLSVFMSEVLTHLGLVGFEYHGTWKSDPAFVLALKYAQPQLCPEAILSGLRADPCARDPHMCRLISSFLLHLGLWPDLSEVSIWDNLRAEAFMNANNDLEFSEVPVHITRDSTKMMLREMFAYAALMKNWKRICDEVQRIIPECITEANRKSGYTFTDLSGLLENASSPMLHAWYVDEKKSEFGLDPYLLADSLRQLYTAFNSQSDLLVRKHSFTFSELACGQKCALQMQRVRSNLGAHQIYISELWLTECFDDESKPDITPPRYEVEVTLRKSTLAGHPSTFCLKRQLQDVE